MNHQTSADPPLAPAAASEGESRFGAQRRALEQVMGLSAECARDHRGLEDARSASVAAANEAFEKAKAEVASQVSARRHRIHEQATTATARFLSTYLEAKSRLESESGVKRAELDQKHRRSTKKVEKEHGDAIWLIDTVLEGETARLHEATSAVRKVLKEDEQALQALRAEGEALARRWRQKLPDPGYEADETPAPPPADVEQLSRALEARRGDVERRLGSMRRLLLPKLFAGPVPWMLGLLLLLVAAAVGHILSVEPPRTMPRVTATPPDWNAIGLAVIAAVVVVGALGWWLRGIAVRRVRDAAMRFAGSLAHARAAGDADRKSLTHHLDEQLLAAKVKHASDVSAENARYERHLRATGARYRELLAEIEGSAAAADQEASVARDRAVGEAEARRNGELAELSAWRDGRLEELKRERDGAIAEADRIYREGQEALVRRWERALEITKDLSDESDRPEFAAIGDWRAWRPPERFAPTVRFGELAVDMRRFIGEARETERGEAVIGGSNGDGLHLPIPEPYAVPALLAFPDHANLLIKHEPDGRDAAVATLRLTMLRLLTSLPPGRVQFTLIDPVGLGRSFAGFMHLADYDDDLVGGRVWTDTDVIEQRLTDLTEHMETVIQKYLRNEFETIDAYNAQAGELAEPYRFVVIADLPTGFSEKAFARLASIAASGTRCGVHVLAALDTRHVVRGSEAFLEDLDRHCNTLVYEKQEDGGKRFRWQDATFGRLPLTLDAPPDESALTDVLRVLGQAARDAKRVEVPFETITPREGEIWSLDSAQDLHVPVGRTGATRLQTFRFGHGVAQHALIGGKTGSGKSTLLNALITNLSLWYAPDQLELYLVDFKRGVEFKAYATAELPHARSVAVESDREFGLSVLQRLDEELARRGDLFRAAGVQDIAAYRRSRSGERMPRVLLIVDEFQEMFSEDDKLTQDAALLIDRLVRQGRAFGIHVILGSQTIGGQSGLGRATLGQMAVRVALQCTEADSQLILGDNNSAARLLNRPGEAIYNDAGGAVENNSPFQVAWLSDETRDAMLQRVARRARDKNVQTDPAIVFEGNAPADIAKNEELRSAVRGEPQRRNAIYLGDPVAIKEPTHILLRRQAGANVIVVGQQEENALAAVASTFISLSATAAPGPDGKPLRPRFVLLDGTPGDSPRAGYLARVAGRLPVEADVIDYRAIPDAFADLADELKSRLETGAPGAAPVVLVIHGVQRYRSLTRSDEFSFAPSTGGGGFADILGDDADATRAAAAPQQPPGQVLLDLLRDGPMVGMHVVMTVDTLAGLERRLGRDVLREFDARVLFQMSGNDSSVLVDSLAASRLGFYRALVASEEQGTLEKFRPYAPPDEVLLGELIPPK